MQHTAGPGAAPPAPLTPMRVQADAAAAPLSAPAAAEAGWKVQMRQDDTAVRSNKHNHDVIVKHEREVLSAGIRGISHASERDCQERQVG